MTAHNPNAPLRTDEVARILGWGTKRTARYLDGLAAIDPSIVIRVRGRRRVTLASIRRVDKDFAKKVASQTDLENLLAEHEELSAEHTLLAERLAAFQRKSWDWYHSLRTRVRVLEKRTEADGSGQPPPP